MDWKDLCNVFDYKSKKINYEVVLLGHDLILKQKNIKKENMKWKRKRQS